jgi:nicotinamide-nucleotide amidase
VLLAVGTELSEGVILNTHFRFLGSALQALGISVLKGVQVPDEAGLFEAELRMSLDQADLVIVTGGLGPTSDDLTREVAARAAGVSLEFRDELWRQLLERYAGGTLAAGIPASNRKQAYIPAGFDALANSRGTAPGFCGAVGKSLLVALPGPPAELEPMFLEQVVARLAPGAGQEGTGQEVLVGNVLLSPESVLEETLQRLRREDLQEGEVRWGTRVADDRIVLTLRGGSKQQQERMFRGLCEELGPLLVRRADERPVERLFEILRTRGLTVSFAESCTGGLLCKLITDLPGSSQVFRGGIVAYDNELKTRLLKVPKALLGRYGAVSREAAEAMSAGLLSATHSTLGVAVTCIAGPAGGTEEKPVGTVWISGRTASGLHLCIDFHLRGSRDMVRRRSAVAALLVAECLLTGADASGLRQLPG